MHIKTMDRKATQAGTKRGATKRRRRPDRTPRGVKKQFFGVVLLSLGLLNTMLSLKTGIEPDVFNYFLVLAGAIILSVGIWQARD